MTTIDDLATKIHGYSLQIADLREALREVLDALGAIDRPWELEGHGIPAKRAEAICELVQ